MIERMKENKADVVKIMVLALIIIWIICFFIDYFRARQSKMPIFCLSENTKEYSDGTTYTCTGLGYKIIVYNRANIPTSLEFGPFFIKERTK